jgi:hypothetical protein
MKKLFIFLFITCLGVGLHAQDKMKTKMAGTHHMKDCVMMENGKMTVMKSGKTMDMDQDVTMTNGTVVMKDGTVKTKAGKTMMLKDGDCVMMNGSVTHAKMKSKGKNKM